MLNFNTTKEEMEIITQIVDRADKFITDKNIPYDRVSILMDISATHCNGCPLDLEALLKADDPNFFHDIFGIYRHINRQTGKLEACFVPRFARKEDNREETYS